MEKSVCFTGHRIIKHSDLEERLDKTINKLCEQGYIMFITGGALGFDTLAALAVLRAKEKHPHIKLVLALPFPAQADKWKAKDREQYYQIQAKADDVHVMQNEYSNRAYFARNEFMVNNSSICISYQCKNSGGTAFTTKYARKNGREVINLYTAV